MKDDEIKESKIQHEIVKYLQKERRDIYFFSVPNEAAGKGKGAQIRMSQLKSMGLRSGVSDLILLLPGSITLFIEVKTVKGIQSDKQKRFEIKVNERGFNYFLVRSLEDLKKVLDNYPVVMVH